jgi:hypothetical protein
VSLQPGHATGAVPGLVPSPDYHHQVLRGDKAGVVACGLPAGVPIRRDGRRQPHHPQPSSPLLRRRLKPSFGRTSSLREDRRKTPPRRPSSVARRRRPRRRCKQNATPLTWISSLLPSIGILGSLPEGPTCSTSCSRSCAPITGVPSSTPLKNATCSGVTSTRPDPRQKVAKTKATTRRGATRKRSSQRSTTAS